MRLPEKVDVIISEWMGGFGVDENMLAPLIDGARSLAQAGRQDHARARDRVHRAGVGRSTSTRRWRTGRRGRTASTSA